MNKNLLVKINESHLKEIIKRLVEELDEINHRDFHTSPELEELRNNIDKGKNVSVAFVKKDGTVRHMVIKKFLKSYVASDAEKTEKQMNVEENHNLKKVVDISFYNKELKNLRKENAENPNPLPDEELKKMASKKAWRSINLETILGFLYAGKFKDLRDENNIREKFGQDIYDSLTQSMVRAMNNDLQNAEVNEI